MSPDSLHMVLPGIALADCIPARCTDHQRTFGVAFPNDGSEPDKAYFDADGTRPEFVLFCDMPEAEGSWLNGVCIPVDTADIQMLEQRELRYDLVDVTDLVTGYDSSQQFDRVFAFIGSDRFTAPEHIVQGVLHRQYLDTVREGVRHWESRTPGFLEDFDKSTTLPDPGRIRSLVRVDFR